MRAWAAACSASPRQFSEKSFRNYVVANPDAHNVGAMLILYRLA